MDKPLTQDQSSKNIARLLDVLIVLAKYSSLIIGVSIAVTVGSYFYLFFGPNKYTATARILPPQQNFTLSAQLLEGMGGGQRPGSVNAPGGGGAYAALLGLNRVSDLYVGIMTGDTIIDRIGERFKLRELLRLKTQDSLRKNVKGMAKITSGRDGLIVVEVNSKDPVQAAVVANGFVEELDRLLQEMSSQEASSRLSFMEKERSLVGAKLSKAEEDLRTFGECNNVVQIDAQTRGVLEYIARLRAEIDAKEVQVQVLRQQATQFNYDVIRLETELKGLKDKLKAAEIQYDQSYVGNVCLTSSKVPALGLEYLRLFRETKYQEGLYHIYTRMVEMARLELAKDVPVVSVVDRATPPDHRSNKRLFPAMTMGGLAFCLLVTGIFVREYWQRGGLQEKEPQRLAELRYYLEPWLRVAKLCRRPFKKS